MNIGAKSKVLGAITAAFLSLLLQFPPPLSAQPSDLVMPQIAGSGELAVYGVWNEASRANVPATARAISVQDLHPDKFGILKRFTKLEVIDLGSRYGSRNITADALKVLAGMPSLKAINAWGCNEFEGNWLEAIGGMKQLRELAIGGLATVDSPPRAKFSDFAKAIVSAGVERLDIGRAQFEGSFLEFAKAAKCLKHLSIDNHYDGQRLPIDALIEVAALPIEWLEIEQADLTDEFFSALSKNKVLSRLRLLSCTGVSAAGLAALARAPNLCSLGFWYINNLSDAHIGAISTISGLEVLDLTLMSVTTRGKRGEWPKEYKVSADAFRHLTRLPKLTTLVARATPAMNDAALGHIAKLKHLKILDITENDGWTAKGVAALAESPLEDIRLDRDSTHDSPMNDDVLKALSALQTLKSLSLNGCVGATSGGAAQLAKLKSLHTLFVAACPWVEAKAVAAFAKIEGLERLYLHYCDGVNDEALTSLKGHKALRVLGVYGCGNVTDKSVEVFKSLPQLSSLDLRRTTIFGDSAAKLAKDLADRQVEVAHY